MVASHVGIDSALEHNGNFKDLEFLSWALKTRYLRLHYKVSLAVLFQDVVMPLPTKEKNLAKSDKFTPVWQNFLNLGAYSLRSF